MRSGHFVNLPHYRVDHEIGRVGFDHVGGGRGTDDVGLIDSALVRGWVGRR